MGESIIGNGWFLAAALSALGLLVGTYGSLIGVGGALLLVPALLFLFPDADPLNLTAIALAVVFLNGLGSAYAYGRQKRIDYGTGLLFAAATLPGLLLGIWTLQQVSRGAFTLIFGLVMIVMAVLILVQSQPKTVPAEGVVKRSYNRPLGVSFSAAGGYLAGLLGIGGGIIHVPVMVYILGFPTHIATATSSFILVFTAAAGALVHLSQGNYGADWDVVLWLAAGVIIGSQIGARLSKRLKGSSIIRLLAVALVITGIRLAMG
jgi:hypothetical protein